MSDETSSTSARPGTYVSLEAPPSEPHKWSYFQGLPLDRETIQIAKASYHAWYAQAKRYAQYVQFPDVGGTWARAFYGVSGQSIYEAELIRSGVLENVTRYAPQLRDLMVWDNPL